MYVYLYTNTMPGYHTLSYEPRCTHALRWSENYIFSKIDIDWLRLIRESTYKYKSEFCLKLIPARYYDITYRFI